jgi:hypothetical protein
MFIQTYKPKAVDPAERMMAKARFPLLYLVRMLNKTAPMLRPVKLMTVNNPRYSSCMVIPTF